MNERTRPHWASRAILVVVTSTALACAKDNPTSISASEAASHVGETETVCGTVASSKFASSSNRSPTFLTLDRPYPNQVFTAVIWGSDRSKFKEPPEVTFQGKRICVTGAIQLYKDRPEIIVSDPSQIH
jgi:DNA/RNA endonuclease YhcR with UshA esterase domain